MVDMPGTLAELTAIFPDNTVGAISPADLRRFLATVVDPRIINVKQEGAIGDGVTDDSAAFQDALDAIIAGGAGGTLYIPPGPYSLGSTGLAFDPNANGPLIVQAQGAEITYSGTGIALDLTAGGTNEANPWATIVGGDWIGTSSGQAAFRISGGRNQFWGVTARGFSTGRAFHLINLGTGGVAFSERNEFLTCRSLGNQHAFDFEVDGGNASFARTRVMGLYVSGGVANEPLINCRDESGVYDSQIWDVKGNIATDAILFHLGGGMGGTSIGPIGTENNTTYTGIEWGTFGGSSPMLLGPWDLRGPGVTFETGTRPSAVGSIGSTSLGFIRV
ncbi:MAG: hypothetical protein GEU71_14765, partial [Actinobacteria bacterium]|nr:hypothetical protein [Actinomycetota bacterium]